MWSFTWQEIRNKWTPSKEHIRIWRQITSRATVQINIVTKCLKVAIQQGTKLSNLFPLFCLDNICKPTSSKVSSNMQQRSHKDAPTVEEMLGINYHVQDKLMSGQHSAQNGNVVLDIRKVMDVDSRQQKHWIRQWFGVNWASECSCSCSDHQQEERAADQYWLFWGRPTLAFIADAWENSSGTLLSQALLQYWLLVAVVYKAVLQLRGKKDTEIQPAGAWPWEG